MGKITSTLIKPLLIIIKTYQYLISPLLGQRCRFYPSCSFYACQSLKTHGFLYGCFLATRRILRCHPWSQGGLDPVPERRKDVDQTT